MDQLRYDGRVAIVTGAGGGLGKAYALLLASRGAKVVVNDLGGGRDGSGKSNFADAVVKEIKDKGGFAVADYSSVVEGDKIIKTALDNFGRVDILINNAGILRDRSFVKMADQDWDLIFAVHVKGAYKTTQAAWEVFRKQKYGRIIMTSSNAGVCGNFGQSNYSAAKLSLVGLANTLALEGDKYNIKVNTIVPTAGSRLTEDILPPEMFAAMQPELIAPVVAYMVHESFEENGAVIDSTMGYAAKIELYRGVGSPLRKTPSDPVTIESVKAHWAAATNMSKPKPVGKISEVTIDLANKIQDFQDRAELDGDKPSYWTTYNYDAKDLVLYALGVGSSVANPSDLKFLYESHEDFTALPTYFILPGMVMESDLLPQAMPAGKHADFTNILHGEQYIEFLGEYPGTEGEFTTRTHVVDVLDKGSSAVVVLNSEIYQNKELQYRTQQHVVVVGQGGFGGPRTSSAAVPVKPTPKGTPHAVVEQKTADDQAALYRLSGDLNPLHIDPSMAAAGGQPRPILHGLSSLGFSARHVLARYGGNDPANLKSLKARFVKPVLPGQTLITEMWLDGNTVLFQTKIKETGNIVISGAHIELKKVVAGHAPSTSNVTQSSSSLKTDSLFAKIKDEITKNPDKARSVGGVFVYNITDSGKTVKQWTLDLKNAAIHEGAPKGKADTTMTIADNDLMEIVVGSLNPQVAYLKGKLKISGNIMLAQKLGPLLKSDAKL